ncbi:MAG: metallophosphoesterase [Draconibacterium sp.]|nr:metallophosphoesterase [Draconibacterium sp.]
MSKEYYFISDLHIGGDGELQKCNFEDEIVEFLAELENKEKDTELIIVGDSFGLWEFTELEGVDKLEELINHHQRLFNQFRLTGEKIKITIVPGNHDYELACYPKFIKRLKDFNITVEPKPSTIRRIEDKKIWIEHGMQNDENNRMVDYGNPHANPLGYFITRHIVTTAGKQSSLGRYNWLKDLQSVKPLEEIPRWIFSNYFYREMNLFLRLMALPFLLLFSASVIVVVCSLLEKYGVLSSTIFTDNQIFRSLGFGFVGDVIDMVIMVNGTIILFLIPLVIPLFLFIRDVKKTIQRFKFYPDDKLIEKKESRYFKKAKALFAQQPDIKVYVFGHTHHAFIEKLSGGVIINTGTWLKQLKRISSRFRLLPDVYYPHYCLNYFTIKKEDEKIAINYYIIEKEAPPELSLLQRFVIFGRGISKIKAISQKTLIDCLYIRL